MFCYSIKYSHPWLQICIQNVAFINIFKIVICLLKDFLCSSSLLYVNIIEGQINI